MAIITPDDTRSFISTAKFVGPPPRTRGPLDEPPVELKATEAQALVVGSSLVVASADVPVTTRQDLINCTLFAQLAAGGEVADPSDVVNWYAAYFRGLTALGWAQSDVQFEQYDAGSKGLEANKAIIEVLTVLLGPQAAALAVVKTTLDALASMDQGNPWITLFNRESKSAKSAKFQVATAQIDANGLLEIALVGFNLQSKSTLTQVLFFKYGSNKTKLSYASGKATIYEAALAGQRAAIAQRLDAYRTAYVMQVKFPPAPGTRAASNARDVDTQRARAMAIQLKREQYLPGSTIGRLFIDGAFECFTLEDGIRTHKVDGETAIPAGAYSLVINYSPRFKADLPRLLDVPGFEGILIHPGNTSADTRGCILVGRSWQDGSEAIGESRVAFAALKDKLAAAIARGEQVSVHVMQENAPAELATRSAPDKLKKARSPRATKGRTKTKSPAKTKAPAKAPKKKRPRAK